MIYDIATIPSTTDADIFLLLSSSTVPALSSDLFMVT